jgi:predicted TIM-barrel fold metal-dependent hydrolase
MPDLNLADAHRHIGLLPAFGFYGGAPANPDTTARGSIAEVLADLDAEGVERALLLPNYGVPDPDVAFAHNELVLEAAQTDDRIRCGLWVSALPRDAERTRKALTLAGEPGVKALKLSFLLGGRASDPASRPLLDEIFAAARQHGLVVHVHTSPGAASDVDEVGFLVDTYADEVAVHLVHLGGGMSGHIKLIGGRFFEWLEQGKRVYTDTSWAIGFAPRWLAAEIERRGIGHENLIFASDEPWGDALGERVRLAAAVGDGELGQLVFSRTFARLYD